MNYLIDSHVLLWLIAEDYKVGPRTVELLSEESATVFVSVASFWELGLKYKKGRLPINARQIIEGAHSLGTEVLEIKLDHVRSYDDITMTHTDPFDLMLCAQANYEHMTLVTADKKLLSMFSTSIDARL